MCRKVKKKWSVDSDGAPIGENKGRIATRATCQQKGKRHNLISNIPSLFFARLAPPYSDTTEPLSHRT